MIEKELGNVLNIFGNLGKGLLWRVKVMNKLKKHTVHRVACIGLQVFFFFFKRKTSPFHAMS